MEATAILFFVSIIVTAIHTNLSLQLSLEFGDWFRHLDIELRDIYHNTATFAWRSRYLKQSGTISHRQTSPLSGGGAMRAVRFHHFDIIILDLIQH